MEETIITKSKNISFFDLECLKNEVKFLTLHFQKHKHKISDIVDFPSIQGNDGKYLTIFNGQLVWGSNSNQLQSNWLELNPILPSFILNKPTNLSQFIDDLVITKGRVGLGNVDNTSDINKPISNDTQDAIDLKLDIEDFKFTQDIPVVLSSGKVLGKYVNGDIIPAIGKNPLEVIRDIATEYLNPTFSFFSVNISSLLEVGVSLSGNKTFSWGTTNNSNITTNSLLIRDVTSNIVLGSGLANDGSEILDIGIITNTTPITRNWRIEGTNTNSVSFQSNNYTTTSIYPVFYGVSNSAPIANQALINLGNKNVVNSNGTINITFGASGQYLWFAHPASNTTKTKWYVNALDNGNIGVLISDLFSAPNIVIIDSPTFLWNGISYKIYFSNTPVNTTGNMELRNS